MVGHTELWLRQKPVKQLTNVHEKVITTALAHDYTVLVIADHGNCETTMNPDGSPNTAHTTNPSFYLVDKDLKEVHDGVLGDIV
jgi:2,3-bisphosphoglycerate-independent phosphoglycerate mutase